MDALADFARTDTEHLDVLIVGAGLSGIGAAWHLQDKCPGKSYAILEARASSGGTWDLFRYPGIRSDSDMYTLGYSFRPWKDAKAIADGPAILSYIREVASDHGIDARIRYGHRVVAASWSTPDARWTVEIEQGPEKRKTRITCGFLWMCSGYYDYAAGYTPEFPGIERFKGRIVHPQTWPKDIDLKGKQVIVIGSGATAATLVPNIADDCAHVTMLQRSPTYFIPARNANDLADQLRKLEVDAAWIHEIVRRRILHDQSEFTRRSFEEPEKVKAELLAGVRAYLGPDNDIDTHFTPSYRPWRQRIAFVPDGDLFRGIRSGKASVVTGEIERFTEKGILLKSGKELPADIIVTATGFHLNVLGDIAFAIDDNPLDFSQTVTYRGMMFTGIPNMAWVFGYFRASWTLRSDLVADFVCRLLGHMKDKQARRVEVVLRPEDKDMPLLPWIDTENFNPGYVTRGMHLLPKRGDKREWQHTQDYWHEKNEFPAIDLDDRAFVYN